MKVSIGPYLEWYGPYQLAKYLRIFGVSEDQCDRIGEYLSNTWVNDVCQWVHDHRKRTVKVHIDKFDTWSMDNTLALIVLPMLKQLQETKHGAPHVDDEDVPEELRSTSAPAKENDWDIDENHFKRWDFVLNEMIFAFETECDPTWEEKFFDHGEVQDGADLNDQVSQIKYDRDGHQAIAKRMQNGFRLFGKYYQNLWD